MGKRTILLWVIGGIILLVIIVIGVAATKQVCLRRSVAGRLEKSSNFLSSAEYIPKESRDKYRAERSETVVSVVRKLIRKAELNLEVKSCEEVSKKINGLVNNYSGIIVDSEIQKYPNEAKRARTILKVPPKDFDTILARLKEFGKVDLERVIGEDVTEEYIDLEARLKNLQAVKTRLLAILNERAREVKDILEVERELNRVGEEIERIEGRMKYLDRQVELATITVNYYEPKAVTPEPLNIVKRFKETIRTAIEVFINVFNGAIVVIAAILPIIIWLLIIGIIIIVGKKLFKR